MTASDSVYQTCRIIRNFGCEEQIAQPDMAEACDLFSEWMTHSDATPPDELERLRLLGVRLPAGPYRLICLSEDVSADGYFHLDQTARWIQNVFDALAQICGLDGAFLYLDGRIAGIVSCSGKSEIQALYRALRALTRDFQTKQNLRVFAAISNSYSLPADASRAFDENQEARKFMRFISRRNQPDVVVQPADFFLYGLEPDTRDEDTFFGDMSQTISNAIERCDSEMMHGRLDACLDFILCKFPRVSAVHMRAIHFCKPLEMTLVGANLIDRSFVQQYRLVQKIIEPESEDALRAAFHNAMDEIYAYSRSRKQQRYAEKMERIMAYLEVSICDPALSTASLSEQFGMSVSSLTTRFKAYFGSAIPKIIHQKRVEYIKFQLLTTSKSVKQISSEAGYISVATMNRAFLKSEGLYPGQYKLRMLGQKADASSL